MLSFATLSLYFYYLDKLWQIAFLNIFDYVYAPSLFIIVWFWFIQIIAISIMGILIKTQRFYKNLFPFHLNFNAWLLLSSTWRWVSRRLCCCLDLVCFTGWLSVRFWCYLALFTNQWNKWTAMSARVNYQPFFLINLYSLMERQAACFYFVSEILVHCNHLSINCTVFWLNI